jgi:SAM-dependent methyltransferase
MVSPQDVEMAYRLILGREPELASVVEAHCVRYAGLAELRESFLRSGEFVARTFIPVSPEFDQGPPLSVDVELSPSSLDQMFQRVEQCWRLLGNTEPYWSVVSCDQFKSGVFNANAGQFYESGRQDAKRLLAWLARNRIDSASINSCSEYGCGVGRITSGLSSHFPRVFAYDISAPHLELARQHLSGEGRSNVTFNKIDTISSLSTLERVDLVVSVVVLQHNPPPVIAHVIRMLLRSLNSRGLAYFQVPTYKVGYDFNARKYLESPSSTPDYEMHLLPQSSIFRILRDEGCVALEVQTDSYLGEPSWVSNTFLVQKENFGTRHVSGNDQSH